MYLFVSRFNNIPFGPIKPMTPPLYWEQSLKNVKKDFKALNSKMKLPCANKWKDVVNCCHLLVFAHFVQAN